MEELKKFFSEHVKSLQNEITQAMHDSDSGLNLEEDIWERKDYTDAPGGGGITRAFQGDIFENAGVNTSEIYGKIFSAILREAFCPLTSPSNDIIGFEKNLHTSST